LRAFAEGFPQARFPAGAFARIEPVLRQAVVIRQISGAVNGLQFRVQDLEEAVKALQARAEPGTGVHLRASWHVMMRRSEGS
jgi:hypothetical protein